MPVRAPELWGVAAKSLMGLPWRYAIGCIDRLGLILRAEVIWQKPNGLPESVTDRVRRSHESWFHLVKQPRYYSAVDEIREPQRLSPGVNPPGRRDYTTSRSSNGGTSHRNLAHPAREYNPLGKLPGSVWSIPSEPLTVPEHLGVDHFAAFPTEWPRRLILGWSPPGICIECREGRRPLTMARSVPVGASTTGGIAKHPSLHKNDGRAGAAKISRIQIIGYVCACTPYTDHPERRGKAFHEGTDRARQGMNDGNGGEWFRRYVDELANPRGPVREYDLDGWTPQPTCPAVVVDPFGGTGTVALAAKALGRIGVTVDRSLDYCRLAQWRCTDRREIAKAMRVPRPPAAVEGQLELLIGGDGDVT